MAESKAFKQSEKIYKAVTKAEDLSNKLHTNFGHMAGMDFDTFNQVMDSLHWIIDDTRDALNHSYRALTHSEMGEFEENVMGFLPLE